MVLYSIPELMSLQLREKVHSLTILSNIASCPFPLFSSGTLTYTGILLFILDVSSLLFHILNVSLWVGCLMDSTVLTFNSQILSSVMSSIKSILSTEVLLRNSKRYFSWFLIVAFNMPVFLFHFCLLFIPLFLILSYKFYSFLQPFEDPHLLLLFLVV